MALSASSSCTHTVTNLLTSTTDAKVPSTGHPHGLVPLPAKPAFEGSGLQRKKSLRPVKSSAVNARAREASGEQSLEDAMSQVVSKVSEEIATTSEEILDVVDSVIEKGSAGMRRPKSSSGKTNSRTSRRRALVMCLALGMVRPCASNVASNLQQGSDLRRTASEAIQRTASSSFQVPTALVSQVSLATTFKQTNFMGGQEDLQKLTTLQ